MGAGGGGWLGEGRAAIVVMVVESTAMAVDEEEELGSMAMAVAGNLAKFCVFQNPKRGFQIWIS